MSAVTVWSKPNCVQCKAVYRAFDKAGVDYQVKNLPDHPEQLQEFIDAGFTAAPVVVAEHFTTFAGFSPDEVKAVIARHAA